MSDPGAAMIGLVATVFALAGFVKGVIGFGLPTIAIALLGLALPPAYAAALVVVPSFVSNLQQMRPFGAALALLRRLWPMFAGIAAGVYLGSGVLAGANATKAAALLGLVLVVYAAVGLAELRLRIEPRHEAWAGPLVGVATGVVTAATGVFVIPAGPYLQSIGFDKDELVQALGLSFFVSTLALAVDLGRAGSLDPGTLALSLAMCAPVLAGMWLGQRARGRVSAPLFRRWFFAGLGTLGLWLVVKAWL
jgi:hypothetical protein